MEWEREARDENGKERLGMGKIRKWREGERGKITPHNNEGSSQSANNGFCTLHQVYGSHSGRSPLCARDHTHSLTHTHTHTHTPFPLTPHHIHSPNTFMYTPSIRSPVSFFPQVTDACTNLFNCHAFALTPIRSSHRLHTASHFHFVTRHAHPTVLPTFHPMVLMWEPKK